MMKVTTALIVDDDLDSRNRARGILTSLGIPEIYVAEDGKDAALKLQSLPALDLVMCDIFMPEKDGIEFLDDLAQRGHAGGLILMSSNGAQFMELTRVLAKRKKLQVWGILNKPLSLVDVTTAISKGTAA